MLHLIDMRKVHISKDVFKNIETSHGIFFFRYNEEDTEGDYVIADEVVCSCQNPTYDVLVSAIIHTRYSTDSELAILANYLSDPTNEQHLAEYNAYQQWRDTVKTACKEYFTQS